MYRSLLPVDDSFTLFVLCIDEQAYSTLKRMDLPNMVLITLQEFENDDLLSVKSSRTKAEYCWTSTPFIIRYCIEQYSLVEVTYLDADLFFFNKPELLLDEFHNTNKSVMITEHRYAPRYDQSSVSGIYCVQFMTFIANSEGLNILQWWQERCLEWCFNRQEDGKFGDQKYLDHWPQQFPGVHVLEHIGGGVAPWNVSQYLTSDGPRINGSPIVFYHFHGLRWIESALFDLSMYRLNRAVKHYIYIPYLEKLTQTALSIRKSDLSFPLQYDIEARTIIRRIGLCIKRILAGNYNIIHYTQGVQRDE